MFDHCRRGVQGDMIAKAVPGLVVGRYDNWLIMKDRRLTFPTTAVAMAFEAPFRWDGP